MEYGILIIPVLKLQKLYNRTMKIIAPIMLQIEGKIKKMPCYQIYKSPEKTRVTHEQKTD